MFSDRAKVSLGGAVVGAAMTLTASGLLSPWIGAAVSLAILASFMDECNRPAVVFAGDPAEPRRPTGPGHHALP